MTKTTVRVTSTHHVAVDFDCPVAAIWDDIVIGIGQGGRFEAQGYRLTPLDDDPAAYMGGYRMWREGHDDPDERRTYITERDDAARRLSLCAYYLGEAARGTVVNATYSAVGDGRAGTYHIDCHGTQDLEIGRGTSASDVAALMADAKRDMDHHLRSALEAQKPSLEASARQPQG